MPDAIGFRAVTAETETVLVEEKVSRGDFLADARKPHREVGNGVGLFRYYMCPAGLISPDEVPERWGLLWVDQRGRIEPKLGPVALSKNSGTFAKACEPWKHQRNLARETWMLVRVMARIDDPDKVKRTINQAIREKERLVKLCNAQADEIRALKAPLPPARTSKSYKSPFEARFALQVTAYIQSVAPSIVALLRISGTVQAYDWRY
jgi:hypothetical protein